MCPISRSESGCSGDPQVIAAVAEGMPIARPMGEEQQHRKRRDPSLRYPRNSSDALSTQCRSSTTNTKGPRDAAARPARAGRGTSRCAASPRPSARRRDRRGEREEVAEERERPGERRRPPGARPLRGSRWPQPRRRGPRSRSPTQGVGDRMEAVPARRTRSGPRARRGARPETRRNSNKSRDFPSPASPTTNAARPRPAHGPRRRPPERGELAVAADERREARLGRASTRSRTGRSPTSNARTCCGTPLSSKLPRSAARSSRDEMLRRFGEQDAVRGAAVWSRAARCVVSPTAV